MTIPTEALVARALASVSMGNVEFYCTCRIHAEDLPKATTAMLAEELEVDSQTVNNLVKKLIRFHHVLKSEKGHLSLTPSGIKRMLIALAMTAIPLPDHLMLVANMPERRVLKLRLVGSTKKERYGMTVYELRRLFARITPDRLRSVLNEYGFTTRPIGNHIYKPSVLDKTYVSDNPDNAEELIVDDQAQGSRTGSDPGAAVSSKGKVVRHYKKRPYRCFRRPLARTVKEALARRKKKA